MTTAPRDPRKDPQPGDRTADRDGWRFHITHRDVQSVKLDEIRPDGTTASLGRTMALAGWIQTSTDDSVLRVAGEPDSPLVSRSDKAAEPLDWAPAALPTDEQGVPFIRVKRLSPTAKLPTRSHAYDAGLDLYANETVGYLPNVAKVETGVAIEIPKGYVGIIKDRSSMAARGWTVAGGVIDHGFSGGIVVVFNTGLHTRFDDVIRAGDKVAQLLIVPCLTLAVVEVDELSQSERGSNGFGSTGV